MNQCCFSLDFVRIDSIDKFTTSSIRQTIQIGNISTTTIIVRKLCKIVSTPLLSRKMRRIWFADILLKGSSRDQKFHFHILMQREALVWCKHSDLVFLHREWPKVLCPWKRHTINSITLHGNFRLCLMSPLLWSSWRSRVHTQSFWEFSIPSMLTKFVIWKENSHSVLFSKNFSNPICKFFRFEIIGKQWFDYFLKGTSP